MSGVLPPPGSARTAGAASPAAAHGVPATLSDVPTAVRQLAVGSLLQGITLGSDGHGRLLLRTDLGVLAFDTKAQPPRGSLVTVQIRTAGSQLHALIMQVQEPPATAKDPAAATTGTRPQPAPAARAPAGGASQTPASGQPAQTGGAHGAPAATRSAGHAGHPGQGPTGTSGTGGRAGPPHPAQHDVLALNRPLPAVVQTPAPGTSAPSAGQTLQLRIIQVHSGTAPAAGLTPSAANATGANAGTPASTPAQAGGATPAAPSSLSSAGDAAGARVFSATVVGSDAAGRPLLQTPMGTLQLGVRASLPTGTELRVELAELPAGGRLASGASGAPRAEPATLARIWPALQEAVDVLRQGAEPAERAVAGPAATQGEPAALANLPQPGPRLASGMLFFLTALGGGALPAWLSRDLPQALERAGRSDLIGRLTQDFGQLSRLASESAGEWRLLPVPVLAEGEVQPLRLFLRRRQEDDSAAASGSQDDAATRFVVELELSRLGELQLDGLIREKRFDLILRSRQALPGDIRADIARIFEDVSSAAGYAGQMRFHADSDWSFLPVEVAPQESGWVV